jgi:hypothetical protein
MLNRRASRDFVLSKPARLAAVTQLWIAVAPWTARVSVVISLGSNPVAFTVWLVRADV